MTNPRAGRGPRAPRTKPRQTELRDPERAARRLFRDAYRALAGRYGVTETASLSALAALRRAATAQAALAFAERGLALLQTSEGRAELLRLQASANALESRLERAVARDARPASTADPLAALNARLAQQAAGRGSRDAGDDAGPGVTPGAQRRNAGAVGTRILQENRGQGAPQPAARVPEDEFDGA